MRRVITTNGYVAKDGRAVMGRGVALQAAKRYPQLPYEFGATLKKCGNHVATFPKYNLITFPVKEFFRDEADLEIISRSCWELEQVLRETESALMPRAGCGAGRLRWSDVAPILREGLSDRVFVLEFP